MPTALLVFEFIGTSELMIIAVVALIIFGPRKLPEIGRSLGKSLGEFKRASEDFKRTWEYEVELEQSAPDRPQTAGGGVEGMSGGIAAGEPEAGGAIARGSAWHEDDAPNDPGATAVEEGAAPDAQGDVTPAQDDAGPDAHGLSGEGPSAHSEGAGDPRGTDDPHGQRGGRES